MEAKEIANKPASEISAEIKKHKNAGEKPHSVSMIADATETAKPRRSKISGTVTVPNTEKPEMKANIGKKTRETITDIKDISYGFSKNDDKKAASALE